MGACDVLVLPSLSEGLPTVICEAMVAGRAVIATRGRRHPGIGRGRRHGLLVAPGDVTALADALGGVLGTPGRADAMGELAA